jgi:hypothetical protein
MAGGELPVDQSLREAMRLAHQGVTFPDFASLNPTTRRQ